DPGQGGASWAVLQYVLGLRRLGHEVVLVEPVEGAGLRPRDAALGGTGQGRNFREVAAGAGIAGRETMLRAATRVPASVGGAEGGAGGAGAGAGGGARRAGRGDDGGGC